MPQPPKPPAADDAATAPQAAEPPVLLWERLDRPPRAPRTTLTHGSIAAAAVDLADREGLDAVSMRKLAGHLGVTTMALYRYVTGKDELLELMFDTVVAPNPQTDPDRGWRDAMRAHAEASRATALAHPWLVELAARQAVTLTPNVMAQSESSLTALHAAGLDSDTAMAVFGTVRAYVRGALADEIGRLELMKRQNWSGGDDLRHAYAGHMKWLLGTGRYPAMQEYAATAVRKDDFAWRFTLGLDCVLDGIAARFAI